MDPATTKRDTPSDAERAFGSSGSHDDRRSVLARAIVNSVGLPLMLLDGDRRVASVNFPFLEGFRLTADQVLGRPLREVADGQWDAPELSQLLQRAIERPGEIQECEIERTFGALGRRSLRLSARRISESELPIESVLLGIEDTSEKRRAEQVLQGERDALLLRVRSHEDALARAQASLNAEVIAHNLTREQLLHANRLGTVGKLMAGLAHEMGTPINFITARGQMILRGQSNGEQLRADVQIMVEQAERVAHLVRELLGYSRQRPIHRPVDDLRALSERTLELLGPAARRNGVNLSLDPTSDALATTADAGEVQQVLTNLVINAVDAQEEGGSVRIHISKATATLPPACAIPLDRGEPVPDQPLGAGDAARSQQWAVISVSDAGPGIPQEMLQRVFEPFFTTKEPGKGTGLGLAVSGSLVRKHGGWITVDNLAEGGTRFSVYLPLEADPR
jgi:PAS domain S-box-containing protein